MPLCNTTQISNTRATVGNLILSFLQRMSGDLLFIFTFTHTVSYMIQSFPFEHCQLQLLCFKTRIKFTVTEYHNGTVFNNYCCETKTKVVITVGINQSNESSNQNLKQIHVASAKCRKTCATVSVFISLLPDWSRK